MLIKNLQTLYITYLLKKGDKKLALQHARKFYLKALKFAKKYGLKDDYAPIYLSIAGAYQVNEKYDQALVALNLAERYPIDDMSYELIIPLKLDVLISNEKLQEARRLAICTMRKSNRKIYELYLTLSEIYLALEIEHKTIIYGKESLEIAWKEEYIEGIELSYNHLLDIYRQANNNEVIEYYLDELAYIGLFDNSAILQFTQYNILVTQKRYHEAKELLSKIELKMMELEHEHLHIFYAITLELFKK
nr:hypothetical protein [Campylobacterota bacterium]